MPALHTQSIKFFRKPAVLGVLVFVVLLLTVMLIGYQRVLLFDSARNRELNNAASNAREKIKAALNYSLSATKTLSFIVTRYNGKNDFDSVAKRILDSNQFIDAMELVEDGTIINVYPLEGNKAAIGYNILDDTNVNKEAYRAVQENSLYFAGPIRLKQGYDAIVGRLPIFMNNKFWGFSVAIIKLPTLLRAAGLDSSRQKDYLFQLSKIDPNTGKEQFFLPDADLFSKRHSVSVNVTEGDWRIYVRYAKADRLRNMLPFAILGLLFAISGGMFAWYGARQPYRLKMQVDEKTSQLQLFIEHSPAALAMFDKDMRYIATSKRWIVDYMLEGKEVIGKSHYELFPNNPQRWKDIHKRCLQGAVERSDEDTYTDEQGRASWLKWEIHPWRRFNGEIGGIIMFTEVITRLKEAELKFRTLVEQSLVGVCIVQDEKFAYVNPCFADTFGYDVAELTGTIPAIRLITDGEQQYMTDRAKALLMGELKSMHFEVKGKKSNGEIIILEVYGSITTYGGRPAIIGTLLEITERKKAEEQLRVSEEKMRMIMDAALDAIISINEDGLIVSWNPQAATIFGWREDEVVGKPLVEHIIPGRYKDLHRAGMENYLRTGAGANLHKLIEFPALRKNGEEFPIELTIIPVMQKDEISFTAFARDISERKKAQEKLVESEVKFRNLVEKSLAGVYIMQDGMVRYINPAHEKMMGYTLQELQRLPSAEVLIHEEDVQMFRDYHRPFANADEDQQQFILRAIRKDGSTVYLEVTTSSIIYEGRPALIGTMLNITDRLTEEMRINRAVTMAQEQERIQIGMELHDNVKQILAAALMCIDFVRSNLDDEKLALRSLTDLKNYTSEAIEELRRLSHQLAPSINREDTFQEQITRLLRTMNADEKLKITIEVDPGIDPLPTDIQTAFFRILQEQLHNIMKYAMATDVSITVKEDASDMYLTIRDNGIGFDTTIKKEGIGLENIRRRAFVLGGKAKVISSPGDGCTVIVQIPVEG